MWPHITHGAQCTFLTCRQLKRGIFTNSFIHFGLHLLLCICTCMCSVYIYVVYTPKGRKGTWSTQNLLRLPRITFFHLTKCLFQLSSPKVNKVLPRNGFGGKWGCFLSPRIGHGRISHRRIGHAVRSSQYFVGVTF